MGEVVCGLLVILFLPLILMSGYAILLVAVMVFVTPWTLMLSIFGFPQFERWVEEKFGL